MSTTPRKGLHTCLCLIVVAALALPAFGALAAAEPWKDNSEHIAAMQAFAAYSGERYKARMDGAIQYIGTLNGSVSTSALQADEQQFLATVSSVGSMTTSDAITQAEQTMKTQIAQFRTDLKTALSAGKGTAAGLKASVDAAETADQATITSLENAWWTARETSRLDEFATNDARRTGVIANLTAKGVDATSAQDIETQIQGEQPALKAALDAHNEQQLKDANQKLDTLNAQFVKAVQGLAWQARETNRLARFDNTTSRMQDRLTNLSARGADVTTAQGILSQILALRPQLQTAMDNHDEAALKGVNSQIVSLDQQFTQALKDAMSGLRNQRQQDRESRIANRTAGNSTAGGRFFPRAAKPVPTVTG
ncbi:MAG TPA: hypothetical protein VEI51_02910 [Methanomicrobiales archaeon]|nr:hypothetical protein [Methanomicrobiales archaeon]